MDAEAWKRGDTAALAAMVDALAPELWAIARRGFVCTDETRVVVHGLSDAGAAEAVVVEVLASIAAPEARGRMSDAASIRAAALAAAKDSLLALARRTGGEASIEDEVDAAGLDDIDRLVAGETPVAADPPAPYDVETHAGEDVAATRAFVAELDERSRKVLTRRYRDERPAREVAAETSTSLGAVHALEARILRKLRHVLTVRGCTEPLGDAVLDGLLSGAPLSSRLPFVTRERIVRAVTTRTFQEEPPPFARRASWAAGAVALAAGTLLLMVLGVLPGPADDVVPTPRVVVECKGACAPGREVTVKVLAPRDAKAVAVVLVGEEGAAQPLLLDEGGGSVGLPFGAKQTLVPIPYPARLPDELPAGASAVAVFSRADLSFAAIERVSTGRGGVQGALTASTALARSEGS